MNPEKARLRRWESLLPPADASRLLEQFLTLPQVKSARTVMVFYGVGREPDTTGLIQALLTQGKQVALPVCLPGKRMEVRLISGLDGLVSNRYGIPEPDETCPSVSKSDIDVALVPHLLCDRAGHRLGHGGGYYDRWLEGFAGLSVAVCPSERLMDALPTEPTDVPVRLVLTET